MSSTLNNFQPSNALLEYDLNQSSLCLGETIIIEFSQNAFVILKRFVMYVSKTAIKGFLLQNCHST